MSFRNNPPAGQARRLAMSALLTALALIFSYVEAVIPLPVGIPGVKLGLANLVVLVALYKLDLRYAIAVNLIRILTNALLFTGLMGALFSLAGGFLSLTGMALLKKTGLFSIIGVSMAGGVLHNLGQIAVAAWLMSTGRIFFYLPLLMFSGIGSGILIGAISYYIVRVL